MLLQWSTLLVFTHTVEESHVSPTPSSQLKFHSHSFPSTPLQSKYMPIMPTTNTTQKRAEESRREQKRAEESRREKCEGEV
jgi:hypothetical protein